jgi:hypothetical protein
MSSDNTTSSKAEKAPIKSTVRGYATVAVAKPPAPEIVNLEIDENDDFGSDPYNRTGSHCVLKLGDDA